MHCNSDSLLLFDRQTIFTWIHLIGVLGIKKRKKDSFLPNHCPWPRLRLRSRVCPRALCMWQWNLMSVETKPASMWIYWQLAKDKLPACSVCPCECAWEWVCVPECTAISYTAIISSCVLVALVAPQSSCGCVYVCVCASEFALTSAQWHFLLIGQLHSCIDVTLGTHLEKVTQASNAWSAALRSAHIAHWHNRGSTKLDWIVPKRIVPSSCF